VQILIVNFQLKGMSHDELAQMADEFGPVFGSQVPGLHEKVFLSDPSTGTYGGVYKFRDTAALEGYLASDIWAGVKGDARFVSLTARSFGVFEGATRAAHGMPQPAVV